MLPTRPTTLLSRRSAEYMKGHSLITRRAFTHLLFQRCSSSPPIVANRSPSLALHSHSGVSKPAPAAPAAPGIRRSISIRMAGHGDLNNSHAARQAAEFTPDPEYRGRSFAIPEDEDDLRVRERYRPFLLADEHVKDDWVAELELSTALKTVESNILDKNLDRSFSRLLAFEASRILFRLGCDVRVYDPAGLPQKDDVHHDHPKVQELRELSKWSDGHVWVSPEQHGNLTAIFKQQIDWIPLSTGAVRPTQGRTLAVAQVNGGSQSFNAVNSLRILGRWMRMFAIPNQSSVPQAYTQFSPPAEGSRMAPSSNRDRLVDCMEELVKYTVVMRPHWDLFGDRYSEREERRVKQRAQDEKERGAVNGVSSG